MNTHYKYCSIILFFLLCVSLPGYAFGYISGRVVDHFSRSPIKGALVTAGNQIVQTDTHGMFRINGKTNTIKVRACGYLRTEKAVKPPLVELPDVLASLFSTSVEIPLMPFTPRALYLSFYGIGHRALRDKALKLIDETEINAVVIDVKGDKGMIPFKSSVPLAAEVGAQKIITVKDIRGLLKSFKEKGIYCIGRIVAFKDNPLARAKPDLAVNTNNDTLWYDRENLAWVDPNQKEVWDYNIDIAIEAARLGFDEIQFDYVRFPDTKGLKFSMDNTEVNRVKAISGFISEAKRRLQPYNVFLAADIFGYVFWNLNDTFIGQRIEELAQNLDYLSPMLYPSGFHFGIPGYRLPVAYPYEIVYLTLKRGQDRTRLPSVRFRPWLQAFRDYAFDKRHFREKEIKDQIRAAETFGSHGWMLWNPQNKYSDEGLKKIQEP